MHRRKLKTELLYAVDREHYLQFLSFQWIKIHTDLLQRKCMLCGFYPHDAMNRAVCALVGCLFIRHDSVLCQNG